MEEQDIIKEENLIKEVFTVLVRQDLPDSSSILFSFSSFQKKNAFNVAKNLAETHGLEKVSKDYWSDKSGKTISIVRLEIDKDPVVKNLFPF